MTKIYSNHHAALQKDRSNQIKMISLSTESDENLLNKLKKYARDFKELKNKLKKKNAVITSLRFRTAMQRMSLKEKADDDKKMIALLQKLATKEQRIVSLTKQWTFIQSD